jgi:hypothetical protein
MLLASGSSPETAMSGAATGLSPSQIDAAQTQLRNGLGSLLAGNDLSSGFDFITGSLSAGSRNGYDRLLDSVSVHLGVDDNAFVQIAPRLGSGNLYLQQNTATVGSISADSGASSVPLNGLNALFERMTSAIATPTACAASSTGMAAQMASNARLAFDSNTLSGPTQVGTALCGLIEESGLSGAHFLNPTLSRCHTEGASPICQVSFAIQATDGSVENVSAGMGAVLEGNTWKFLGSFYPVQIDASARAQRRLNVTNNTVSYDRAIAVGIQPVAGLQCAKVSQPTTVAGVSTPVAYFKLYDSNAQNLSLWTNSQQGNLRSLDPNVGYLRSGDDTWIMLPEGTEGDNVIRNFFRGGRTLTVSMYSDTACTTALNIDGQSEFEVDIDGLPPVWSAMPTLSWPELTSATISSMQSLTLGASESVDFTAAWTFPNGRSGVDEATFCTSGQCGDNEPARVAHRQTSPALPSTTLSLQNSSTPVAASGFKMLALSGSGAGGLRIQSNFIACTTGSECQ